MDKRTTTEKIRRSIAKKDSLRSVTARIAENYGFIEECIAAGYSHKQILDSINSTCHWSIKLSTFDTVLFRLRKRYASGSSLVEPLSVNAEN